MLLIGTDLPLCAIRRAVSLPNTNRRIGSMDSLLSVKAFQFIFETWFPI